jgi:hypothetical protein
MQASAKVWPNILGVLWTANATRFDNDGDRHS